MRTTIIHPHVNLIPNPIAPAAQSTAIHIRNCSGQTPDMVAPIAPDGAMAGDEEYAMRGAMVETGAADPARITLRVSSGAAIIAPSAKQPRMYRVFGVDRFVHGRLTA
jgi:hypothetical protein